MLALRCNDHRRPRKNSRQPTARRRRIGMAMGLRRRLGLAVDLLGAALAVACSQPQAYGPPAPSRVGYERLQQAYAVWQLLDRARDTTAQLKSWRELDPESGSSSDYAIPNRTHYRFFAMDGRFHEGYESD